MAELIETQVQLIAYIDREREKRDAERDAERREREDALEELRHAREGLAEERRQQREEIAAAEAARRHFWALCVAIAGTTVGTVAAVTGVIAVL